MNVRETLREEATNSFVRVHVTVLEGGVDLVVGDVADYLLQALHHLTTRRRNPRQRRTLLGPTFSAHPPHSPITLPATLLSRVPPQHQHLQRDQNLSLSLFLSLSLSFSLYLDLQRNGKRKKQNPYSRFLSLALSLALLSFFRRFFFNSQSLVIQLIKLID